MKSVPFQNLTVTDGFWAERQKICIEHTFPAVYGQFKETGRISTMNCQKQEISPHHFWCSDVFKWLEGAAYILRDNKIEEMYKAADDVINMITTAADEDGYYNSYFQNPDCPEKRFTKRALHELYSFGHMIEAAVAFHTSMNDDRLLELACRSVELINRVFRVEKSAPFITPGHQEIELALVRLYDVTGNKMHLDLAEYFIRMRGNNNIDDFCYGKDGIQIQEFAPAPEQKEAWGHSVRAVYMYSAIADLADRLNDFALFKTADALFDDIYNKKMYITGGIGSSAYGEAFAREYYLPNRQAYTETCASLGLALFSSRMYKMKPDSKYGDACEKALLNSMISGLSLDGECFFYENPLEMNPERRGLANVHDCQPVRVKVFSCSCCPPNLVRLIPSVGNFIYTYDDDKLFVHQYIANEGTVDGCNVKMDTKYPADGRISIKYNGAKALVLRRPAWCDKVVCGKAYTEKDGYLYFDTNEVTIEFVMEPAFYAASQKVYECSGKAALMRGPIVYCLEGKDNDFSILNCRVDTNAPVTVSDETYGGYPILYAKGEIAENTPGLYSKVTNDAPKEVTLKYIPFYTFANRGEDYMTVWVNKQ
ncbi:MAG: glycoside hydrolase family 127 protein [Ruminococcaceae bacterium]|nr:glycoside hydrolase family 127 protein [Oscillospiraceae bacterium]